MNPAQREILNHIALHDGGRRHGVVCVVGDTVQFEAIVRRIKCVGWAGVIDDDGHGAVAVVGLADQTVNGARGDEVPAAVQILDAEAGRQDGRELHAGAAVIQRESKIQHLRSGSDVMIGHCADFVRRGGVSRSRNTEGVRYSADGRGSTGGGIVGRAGRHADGDGVAAGNGGGRGAGIRAVFDDRAQRGSGGHGSIDTADGDSVSSGGRARRDAGFIRNIKSVRSGIRSRGSCRCGCSRGGRLVFVGVSAGGFSAVFVNKDERDGFGAVG